MKKSILYVIFAAILCIFLMPQTGMCARKEAKEPKPLQLEGTEWQVTLTPESGKGSPIQDKLVFKDKKVVSESFQKKDYAPTNYTLSVKDDGSTVFETMQTKGDETVFWQGNIREDQKLRGIVSVHPPKGAAEDYSLSGTLLGGGMLSTEVVAAAPAPAASEAKPEVKAAPAAPAPAAAPAQETKDKKSSKKKSKEAAE